jgi:uncharacterized protein
MRIAIVGGGAAGLTTAWLLNDDHAVTLFERQDRLGGHADTVWVEAGGEQIPVDAGFEFFSDYMFPTFQRLLDILRVARRPYPATATFYTADQRRVIMLPPFRRGRIIWSMFLPRPPAALLYFGRMLDAAARLMETRDTSLTFEQFLQPLSIPESVQESFIYPFLLAGWCVEPDEFKQFAAYDVLRYTFKHKTSGLRAATLVEAVGGTQAYVNSLARSLDRTTVRLSADIARILRRGETFIVEETNGQRSEFERLVIATNACEAKALLRGLDGTDEIRRQLGRIEYFKSTIAVHGDLRLMPCDPNHWSVVNTRWDGAHSRNTVWKGWKSRHPIFKSWVTYETRMPEPLYATRTYYHPKVNLDYFRAQHALQNLGGQDGVWLAGMYMYDVDCHESAVMSAVQVARRLAPQASRLQQLLAAPNSGGAAEIE